MKYRSLPIMIVALAACLVLAGCGGSSSSGGTTQPQNGTPTLSALSTDNALIGSADLTLDVTGTGFASGATVAFGSNTLTPKSVTASQLSVVVPQSLLTTAAIVSVTVTNPAPGGGVSNALEFTIKNPVPTLQSLSVTSAIVGSSDVTVDLTGKGFVAGAKVYFGSTDLVPTAVTDTQVSFVIPETLMATVGAVPITASNPEPGGGVSNALEFTIGNPVPTLTSFVTSSTLINSTGFTLEIDGTGFVASSQILFGTDALTPASVTSTHISVAVPDALLTTARVVPVTVTNPEPIGGVSNALDFGVNNPVPELTALSVDTAEAGTETDLDLTLTGTNFVDGATVDFGAQKLGPKSTNSNKIDVTIPAAQMAAGGMISVTVTNPGPGGGPSNAMTFRINNPVPELTALSQTEAVAGEPAFDLELMGAKFVPTTTIDFGGVALVPTSVTKNSMVVNVPETAFATGGVIQVKAVSPEPGGGPSQTIDFTINNPVPAITSVSPTSVTSAGNDLTITVNGSNFVSTSTVMAGSNQVTSSLLSKSAMQVTLPSAVLKDAEATGSVALTVSNPEPSGGTSNGFNLIVHAKATLTWHPLADTTTMVPVAAVPFQVFGPPAVNNSGTVVFSGQSIFSTAESEETSATLGVYSVDQSTGAISVIADSSTYVPDPNTLKYGDTDTDLAKFEGFPSSANIDQGSSLVGFAGTNPPVVQLPDDGKAGTAGLYGNPDGKLVTGVGLFTLDPYVYFQVPDMPAGTPFGALPASPAVVNGSTFVFKGDYLNGTTVAMGVYYRDITGTAPVTLIASTVSTLIPDSGVKFGYIGAPSAVGNTVVFVGYNRKDGPAAGGIYSAPLATAPTPVPLVTIGSAVPDETDATFTQFGDNISFDGRYVAFWGAWGTDTTTRHLTCSNDGFTALDAYCLTVFPNGFDAQVPVHQGIFVYDTSTNTMTTVAKTGDAFSDFTHWTFVGALPEEGGPPSGTGGNSSGGGEDETEEVPLEAPAFLMTPNVVVAGGTAGNYEVAFDASTGTADGIYMTSGPNTSAIVTAVDTTMPAATLNLNANSTTTIKALYLGREGMQGNWLVIGSTMVDSATQTDSNGVYSASTTSTNP